MNALTRYFQIQERGSTINREILAGLTTFTTMSYIVVVNPAAPVGPRDIKPTPTGKMILDAASGKMPFYIDTGLNIVHVDDVATGHVLALEHGRIGERYVLGGEDMTLQQILGRIAALKRS